MGNEVYAEELIFQREDLEEQWRQRFPWLIKRNNENQDEASRIVSCFVGVGWFQLLTNLFQEIENHCNDLNEPLESVSFYQIEEKYGTLRVSMDYYVTGVEVIISKYENLSAEVCEICGEKGELRDGQWIYTLCDDCLHKGNILNSI